MRRALVILAAAVCAGALALPGAATQNAGGCTHWVAAGGNDGGPGSRVAPYGTVAKLLAVLRPGQTGCFAPGTTIDEHIVISARGAAGKPITLTSTPNAQGAILRGGIEFSQSSHDVVIQHVAIRATATPATTTAIVVLRGFRNAILDSDVNGTDTPDRNQSCILLDHANRALIDHNAIRECSKVVTRTDIYAAGIIDAVSASAQITNNVIVDQPSDAIALAPNAQYTTVARNLMQRNGSGVYFGGSTRAAANDNLVSHNAIGPSKLFSVHASYNANEPVGKRNIVSKNCFWQAGKTHVGIATAQHPGFKTVGNVVANPSSSRCASSRPGRGRGASVTTATAKTEKKSGAAKATKPLGSPLGLVAGAAITGSRVTLLKPVVTGVASGATVTVRCVQGCKLSESSKASGSRVSSRRFDHATLSVGDVVEIRSSKKGFLGRVARFVVKPSVSTGIVFRRDSSGCLRGTKRVACPK